MAWPQMAGIRLDSGQPEGALARGQGIGADALIRDDDIGLERHRLLASIWRGIALGWQVGGGNGLNDYRLLLLGQGEGVSELWAVALLRVTFTQSGVGAAVGGGRLRTPECRRHHDVVLEDK